MAWCLGILGKKSRDVCNCKKRCNSWFPANAELRKGCRNVCSSNSKLNDPSDYLCSGKVNQNALMLAYGYDPCLADGDQFRDVVDPFREENKNEQIVYGLAGLVLISVLIYVLYKLV